METLKTAKAKYKEATQVVDLAVVLTNKTMGIINGKLMGDAERVNKQIATGNLEKLKKFSPVLVEPLKHYMTLVTSMNLLVAASHAADYKRKMILRALLRHIEAKGKDPSGKRTDYILGKVNIFEKHLEDAIDHIKTVTNTVKYFDGMFVPRAISRGGDDRKSKEGKPAIPQTVTNLGDVAKILTDMAARIEKRLAEVRLVNKKVLKIVAKKGSYENIRTQDFDSLHASVKSALARGGADHEVQLGKVTIVGGAENDSETYIGGYKVDQDLAVKTTWLQAYKQDKVAMEYDATYAKMMNAKLKQVFGGDPDSPPLDEIADMSDSDYYQKTKEDLAVDELLQKQVESILDGKLTEFRAYYIKHRNQYLSEYSESMTEAMVDIGGSRASALSVNDGYLKFNLVLDGSATVGEKVEYIVKYVRAVLGALDKVDVAAMHAKAEEYLMAVNAVKTESALKKAMQRLDEAVASVEDKKDYLHERKRIKTEIRENIDAVLKDQAGHSNPLGLYQEKPAKGAGVGELAEFLLQRDMGFHGALGAAEQAAVSSAQALGRAFEGIESLMSPDNKDPCVCKAITLLRALMYVDLLKQRLTRSKQFKKLPLRKKYLDRLGEIRKSLEQIAGMSLPILYEKKLEVDNISKLGVQLLDSQH